MLPVPNQPIKSSSITDHDVQVYKKLCQDLENLVQLTKGIDKISTVKPSIPEKVPIKTEETKKEAISEPSVPEKIEETNKLVASKPLVTDKTKEREKSVVTKPSVPVKVEEPQKVTVMMQQVKPSVREIVDSIKGDEEEKSKSNEPSPIKREMSNILDNLKTVGEDCEVEKEKKLEHSKPIKDDKLTKEKSVPMEDEDAILSNVPTVKLNKDNDCKSKDITRRKRSSLSCQDSCSTSTAANNWEGERCSLRSILSHRNRQQSVSMICSAAASAHQVTRLTAKCIFHITNHLTVQCCILLVFFLVLLLAIFNNVP